MASLVWFTLTVALLFSASVEGQTNQYFTDSTPWDYYQRASLNDCPLRFYPNPEQFVFHAIHGGHRARIGDFQHMASIGWTTNGKIAYLCGGTLISSKFVLTAAHCAVDGDGNAPDTVRLGDTNLAHIEDDQTAQQLNIRDFKKHPQYRPSRKYYDIALIELEAEARFDEATCPACLWLEKEVPPEEMEAIGFGATGYGESLSPTLQKVQLSAIDKSSCVERLPVSSRVLPNGYVDEQFCAGSDHMDTCEGDSGGPIQIERTDVNGAQIPLVVGIVSFGTPCTNGSLGVYTRIASYREWIEQEIQQPVDYLTCARTSTCFNRKYSYSGVQQNVFGPLVRVGLLWNSSESSGFQCGATLVDYRFVLTSAFCAREKRGHPKYIAVESTGEKVEIDRVIVHPQFKSGGRAYDIALLKLEKSLNPSHNLLPACLLVVNEQIGKSKDLWHYSAYSTRYTKRENFQKDNFKEYEVIPHPIDDWDCTTLEHKQDNITCRKTPTNLIPTVCHIDHGGPVYTTGNDKPIPYLHGVVSDLSEGCGGELITIGVSPHVEWIERVILDHTDERLVFQ